MDVKIEVITGGGKKANKESKSITLKEVQTKEQVIDALNTNFKEYFPVYQTLDKTPGKQKEKKA